MVDELHEGTILLGAGSYDYRWSEQDVDGPYTLEIERSSYDSQHDVVNGRASSRSVRFTLS